MSLPLPQPQAPHSPVEAPNSLRPVPASPVEAYSAFSAYPGRAPRRSPLDVYRRYLLFLRRTWYVPALTSLLFAGLAVSYIKFWPMSYVSLAHMWAAGKVGLQLREGASYSEDAQNFAGTQVELLQSATIMDRALARVRKSPGVMIPTNSEGNPIPVSIKVSQLPKSAVLELKAKGPTEDYTRAFLDAAMDEFLAYKREIRSVTSGDTYTSVSEQISRQEADLKAAQYKLTTYQRDNNVAVLEEQAKAASVYLTKLLAEFSQLKLEYQLLEAMTSESLFGLTSLTNPLVGAADPRKLTDRNLPSATPPPEFLSAQQELEKVRIIRARLSKNLRPEHPKIVKLDEEISRAEKLVEYFSQQSRNQLASAKQTVKLSIDQVQETIKEWEAKVNSASERIAEYQRMKLDVERVQSLHDRLLGLLQAVDVTRNLDQENITILDRASGTKSGKLSSALILAFCLFVGLGAGLALVFLVEQTDDRLCSLEELTERFEEWIIGQVPETGNAKNKKQPALLDVNDNRHMLAESYRNLRSALLFLPMPGDPPKVLLITSAIPSEGKSTVAANLARALVFSGSRVLLVDGDLRKGSLDMRMDLKRAPGLADILSNGAVDPNQFVIPIPLNAQHSTLNAQSPPSSDHRSLNTDHRPPSPVLRPLTSGLFFLSRGGDLENPGDLFLSPKLDCILRRWREDFDYVLIDSCPVFASDDATTLAPKVDGTLFVVRSRFTRAGTVHKALELLYQRQAKVLGLVFSRADSSPRGYEYYKYRDYHHTARPLTHDD